MATPSAGAPAGEARVSTGNAGLDAMLDGGLVPHRPYLIVGPSGTGKTTLALQFLCAGIRQGEPGLLVTLEEPPNEIRANHHGLEPELGRVDVFDAIPDVMRYERTPFKDIAAVRSAIPFGRVPEQIRRTPELTSIEVTITALEQMLRTEVQRHGYRRIAIDSLTALQYFCMKGFDVVAGAQTFLRFLSDLRVTTLLNVEAPLEDVETPERMLARGEIRLFRWELDDLTVRAIGVEKFRGSSHDIRLHPYRIGPRGIDINLSVTISRDTRQVIEAPTPIEPGVPVAPAREVIPSALDVLTAELHDLALVGADLEPIRSELEAALASARSGDVAFATERLTRALAIGASIPEHMDATHEGSEEEVAHALRRLATRAESGRAGYPPVRLPEPPILTARLTKLLADIAPEAVEPTLAPAVEPVESPAPMVPASTLVPSAPPAEPAPPEPEPLPVAEVRSAPPAAAPAPPTLEAVSVPSAPPAVRHARPAPPPLPQAMRMPEPERPTALVAPPATPSKTRASRARAAPSPRVAVPSVPAVALTAPAASLEVTPTVVPAGEATAPKKRKRAVSASRKKSTTASAALPATPTSPAPVSTVPLSEIPAEPPVPSVSPPPTPILPATTLAPEAPPAAPAVASPPPVELSSATPALPASPPKPKRRVARKKKAPLVVGATPGPVPEEDATTAPVTVPSEPAANDRPPEVA